MRTIAAITNPDIVR